MKINRIKLMKQLLKFGSVTSDKGELYYEGEVGIELEVFVEGEDGEMVPAEDGEYVVDKQVWVIVEGKVSEIKEAEPKDFGSADAEPKPEPVAQAEPVVEPVVEPTEEVKALEAKVKELEDLVAAKDEEINQLKEQLKEPAALSAKQQFKNDEAKKDNEIKANPALKYFQTK